MGHEADPEAGAGCAEGQGVTADIADIMAMEQARAALAKSKRRAALFFYAEGEAEERRAGYVECLYWLLVWWQATNRP